MNIIKKYTYKILSTLRIISSYQITFTEFIGRGYDAAPILRISLYDRRICKSFDDVSAYRLSPNLWEITINDKDDFMKEETSFYSNKDKITKILEKEYLEFYIKNMLPTVRKNILKKIEGLE